MKFMSLSARRMDWNVNECSQYLYRTFTVQGTHKPSIHMFEQLCTFTIPIGQDKHKEQYKVQTSKTLANTTSDKWNVCMANTSGSYILLLSCFAFYFVVLLPLLTATSFSSLIIIHFPYKYTTTWSNTIFMSDMGKAQKRQRANSKHRQ